MCMITACRTVLHTKSLQATGDLDHTSTAGSEHRPTLSWVFQVLWSLGSLGRPLYSIERRSRRRHGRSTLHLSSRIGRKALLPECLFFFIKNLKCLHLTIYTRCRICRVAFWCQRYPRGYPYLIPLSRRGGIFCVHFCEYIFWRNLYWRHRRWRLCAGYKPALLVRYWINMILPMCGGRRFGFRHTIGCRTRGTARKNQGSC